MWRTSRLAAIFVSLALAALLATASAQDAERPELAVGTLKEGTEPKVDGKADD